MYIFIVSGIILSRNVCNTRSNWWNDNKRTYLINLDFFVIITLYFVRKTFVFVLPQQIVTKTLFKCQCPYVGKNGLFLVISPVCWPTLRSSLNIDVHNQYHCPCTKRFEVKDLKSTGSVCIRYKYTWARLIRWNISAGSKTIQSQQKFPMNPKAFVKTWQLLEFLFKTQSKKPRI